MKALLHWSALLSVGLSCGCAADLAWYGHTPDRTQRLEVRQRNKTQWLLAGDKKSAEYDAIATHAFAFAEDGRHSAVAALRVGKDGAQRWYVVRDFHEGPVWDALAGLLFAPGGRHLAYAAERKGRWRVVVDDQAGPPFDAVEPATITWSPDGERWGYIAQDGPCARAVIGTQLGECFRRVVGISVGRTSTHDVVLAVNSSGDSRVRLVLGGDEKTSFVAAAGLFVDTSGEHWAVLADTEPPELGKRMVIDGKEQPSFDHIQKFVWAPKGDSFAYIARRGSIWVAVEGDRISQEYDGVELPVFSSDGARVGHVGHAGPQGFVFVDGKMVWSDKASVTALTFDDRGKRIAFMYRDTQSPVIAVDEARHRYDIVIDGSLRFSHDGRHWAALVGSTAQQKLTMVMDGKTQLPFESEELFGGGLYRNLHDPIGTWVSGELEVFLRGQHAGK